MPQKAVAKIKSDLVCSTGSKEDLEKMINQYFYSTNYIITESNEVYNKLKEKTLDNFIVTVKRGRWRFECVYH